MSEYFDSVAGMYEHRRKKLGKWKAAQQQAIMQALDVKKGELILDAGCGTGFYCLLIIEKGGAPFGVDASEKMVAAAKAAGIKAVVGDIEKMRHSQRFDKALFVGSLEFCRNPAAAIKNSAAALRQNGIIVLTAPTLSLFGIVYALFHLTHGFRVKLFRKKELREMLQQAGMQIVLMRKINALSVIIKAVKSGGK